MYKNSGMGWLEAVRLLIAHAECSKHVWTTNFHIFFNSRENLSQVRRVLTQSLVHIRVRTWAICPPHKISLWEYVVARGAYYMCHLCTISLPNSWITNDPAFLRDAIKGRWERGRVLLIVIAQLEIPFIHVFDSISQLPDFVDHSIKFNL